MTGVNGADPAENQTRRTGTSKKIEYHEKVNIFCHSFQKVKPIY